MVIIRQQTVYVQKGHRMFDICDQMTALGCNLYNATRFRQRQVFTARNKDESDLTENELSVINEIRDTLGIDVVKKKISHLSKNKLYHLMQDSRNPDYYAKGMPAQTAQHIVSQCHDDWENNIRAVCAWKKDPSRFTGKPGLPGYKKKGGRATITLTNQDCTIKLDKNGVSWAYFPLHKKTPLCIGAPKGQLSEAKIIPDNGAYKVVFTFKAEIPDVSVPETSKRIAAIDFGVDNLMAVTNNVGAPCLLYKGGIVKSINQLYNKKRAAIMAEEMTKPGCPKNKAGKPKFVSTPESNAITLKRNNRIHDFMKKAACHFITWCVEQRIDTIVAGVNSGWKQESCIGRVNNQNFVQIPHAYLRSVIRYKAEEHGILFVEQEESYTSKASFLDNDPIPVYMKGDSTKHTFSGKRAPTRYKGMYKKGGFRGLYMTKDGTVINSDLNGSANILRKTFPTAFTNGGIMPDFTKVMIIRNPDEEFILANKMHQVSKSRSAMSKSKAKRMKAKLAS